MMGIKGGFQRLEMVTQEPTLWEERKKSKESRGKETADLSFGNGWLGILLLAEKGTHPRAGRTGILWPSFVPFELLICLNSLISSFSIPRKIWLLLRNSVFIYYFQAFFMFYFESLELEECWFWSGYFKTRIRLPGHLTLPFIQLKETNLPRSPLSKPKIFQRKRRANSSFS